MAPGEGLNERRDVGATAKRQAGKLEARRPTLGPVRQGSECSVGQPHVRSDGVAQHVGCLVHSEAQLRGAQFDQLSAGSQTCQR